MKAKEGIEAKRALASYLSQFADKAQLEDLETVLARRTRFLTVVVEDIYQSHNAAAVMRACECFGVQDLHVVPRRNVFRIDNGSLGRGARRLTIREYAAGRKNPTEACLTSLKKQGYCIAATTLRPGAVAIGELDLGQKLALCFGTEEHGLSEEAHQLADRFVYLPMYGFTQSFNISVSVALSLYECVRRLPTGSAFPMLSPEERLDLKVEWLCGLIPEGHLIAARYLREIETGSA